MPPTQGASSGYVGWRSSNLSLSRPQRVCDVSLIGTRDSCRSVSGDSDRPQAENAAQALKIGKAIPSRQWVWLLQLLLNKYKDVQLQILCPSNLATLP